MSNRILLTIVVMMLPAILSSVKPANAQQEWVRVQERACGNDPLPACLRVLEQECGPRPSMACYQTIKRRLDEINGEY